MSSFVSNDEEGRQRLDRQGISILPVALQRRLIRQILRRCDEQKRAPGVRLVEAARQFLLKGQPGDRLMVRSGMLIQKHDCTELSRSRNGHLTGAPDADRDSTTACCLAIPSVACWGRRNFQFQVQVMTRDEAAQLPPARWAHRALFDADRFSTPLVVRAWQAGDRFCPTGMRGRTKKLQDLFTDLKIRREERGDIPLLVASEGILWVVGKRQDDRFAVRNSTTRCLVVTVMARSEREGAL